MGCGTPSVGIRGNGQGERNAAIESRVPASGAGRPLSVIPRGRYDPATETPIHARRRIAFRTLGLFAGFVLAGFVLWILPRNGDRDGGRVESPLRDRGGACPRRSTNGMLWRVLAWDDVLYREWLEVFHAFESRTAS